MRMAQQQKREVVRHEWSMDSEESPITARDINDLMFQATEAMKALGVNLTYDDSWHIEPRDSKIVIFVEKG